LAPPTTEGHGPTKTAAVRGAIKKPPGPWRAGSTASANQSALHDQVQGATVMVTGVSFVSDPEVPISSMVVVPVGARREALHVMVTFTLPFAGGVTGLAEAVADTPLGNSFTLKSTAELNPFTLVTVRVVDTLPLSSIVKEEGDSDRVKFFVPEEAFTVRAIVVL
jgi:hypothetical protein